LPVGNADDGMSLASELTHHELPEVLLVVGDDDPDLGAHGCISP
jgi:hypothetical protein